MGPRREKLLRLVESRDDNRCTINALSLGRDQLPLGLELADQAVRVIVSRARRVPAVAPCRLLLLTTCRGNGMRVVVTADMASMKVARPVGSNPAGRLMLVVRGGDARRFVLAARPLVQSVAQQRNEAVANQQAEDQE